VDTKQMIGIRIGELRAKKGMTQETLAGKMGINPKYLSSIERGKENPTLDTLIKLAESLEVDLSDIFALVQIEDPRKRKAILESLLKKADDEQLKIAARVLKVIIG